MVGRFPETVSHDCIHFSKELTKTGGFGCKSSRVHSSLVSRDKNLEAFLFVMLALFPFKDGIPLWQKFLESDDNSCVHPQFLINYVIQPINTICMCAERQIRNDFFLDVN